MNVKLIFIKRIFGAEIVAMNGCLMGRETENRLHLKGTTDFRFISKSFYYLLSVGFNYLFFFSLRLIKA